VVPKDERKVLTVEAAMKQLRDSAHAAFEAEDKLIQVLKREGLLIDAGPAGRVK
jgi:regulator of sigma D